MIIELGKGNSYSYIFDATAKTITISGVLAFEINNSNIKSIYNITASGTFSKPIIIQSTVNGLQVFVLTFSTVPVSSANTDNLRILLDLNRDVAIYDFIKKSDLKGNKSVSILPSLARTVTTTSSDNTNGYNKGGHFIIDVTAGVSGVNTLIPKIQAKDAVSGNYYDLLVGAAIVAVGTTVLKIYPSIVTVANVSVNDILPLNYRVVVTHATSASVTYSVSSNLI